jgi:hypothetical protein
VGEEGDGTVGSNPGLTLTLAGTPPLKPHPGTFIWFVFSGKDLALSNADLKLYSSYLYTLSCWSYSPFIILKNMTYLAQGPGYGPLKYHMKEK